MKAEWVKEIHNILYRQISKLKGEFVTLVTSDVPWTHSFGPFHLFLKRHLAHEEEMEHIRLLGYYINAFHLYY